MIFGTVAEWLGRALQKLVQRFESARCLFFYYQCLMVGNSASGVGA